MTTPIHDFIQSYIASGASRLHVPGHKGAGPLGIEPRDITEIAGAGDLYGSSGIIAESQNNASALFASGATFYSAEGSSLCIRAMLYLAMTCRVPSPRRPVALAARNAHKAFLYAAALCDFDVVWLWPEDDAGSLCTCPVTPEALARRLDAMEDKPFCVYVTSPDYLGGLQDIRGLSKVCHAHGIPLIVDNAHGAYLRFLPESLHPLDLGADLCCDSAHKTLPALTGAALLHVSRAADPRYIERAPQALSLFASTSPSWLILESLDLCNARLVADFPPALADMADGVRALKETLSDRGFDVLPGEPMKLTLRGDGPRLAERLRRHDVECEYADGGHVVLMFSPNNAPEDLRRVSDALTAPSKASPHWGRWPAEGGSDEVPRVPVPPLPRLQRAMTIREAVFSPSERVPAAEAVGRVCAAPTVSCPPAVPIAVSGERITPGAVACLLHYGVDEIDVVL